MSKYRVKYNIDDDFDFSDYYNTIVNSITKEFKTYKDVEDRLNEIIKIVKPYSFKDEMTIEQITESLLFDITHVRHWMDRQDVVDIALKLSGKALKYIDKTHSNCMKALKSRDCDITDIPDYMWDDELKQCAILNISEKNLMTYYYMFKDHTQEQLEIMVKRVPNLFDSFMYAGLINNGIIENVLVGELDRMQLNSKYEPVFTLSKHKYDIRDLDKEFLMYIYLNYGEEIKKIL